MQGILKYDPMKGNQEELALILQLFVHDAAPIINI